MSYDPDLFAERAEGIIQDVFGSLSFYDRKMQDILYDSYVANVRDMNRYAMMNNISLRKYYLRIRDDFIQSGVAKPKSNQR